MGHVDMVSGECRCGWPHKAIGWSKDEAGDVAKSVLGGSEERAMLLKLCFNNGEGQRMSWRQGTRERLEHFEEVDWLGWSGGLVFGIPDSERPCRDFLRD